MVTTLIGRLCCTTRRHRAATSLRPSASAADLVLGVNKIDLVDRSECRFDEIREDFRRFAMKLNPTGLAAMPICAQHVNIVRPTTPPSPA